METLQIRQVDIIKLAVVEVLESVEKAEMLHFKVMEVPPHKSVV